jgi:branched-subunit amino acid transport protein
MISNATIIGSGAVLGLGTYAFRVAGPVLRSQVSMSKRVEALMSRAAVVLLVALAATTALTQGHEFAGWARTIGVMVAGVLAWRRAPFVVVIVVAAAVAAGLRLSGIS